MFEYNDAWSFDLDARIAGYDELRKAFFSLQLAIRRLAKGTMADHMASTAAQLVKDVVEDMPNNVCLEWEWLSHLPEDQLLREAERTRAN